MVKCIECGADSLHVCSTCTMPLCSDVCLKASNLNHLSKGCKGLSAAYSLVTGLSIGANRPEPETAQATYDAAIFFDNDPTQRRFVREQCRSIKVIDVDETTDEPYLGFSDSPVRELIESVWPNSYVSWMALSGITSIGYDIKSGVNRKHAHALKKFLRETDGKSRAVIFDWDRTITKCEGVFLEDEFIKQKVIPDILLDVVKDEIMDQLRIDTLRFALGGDKRLHLIRHMFKAAHAEPNTDIFLLTNNGRCGLKSFDRLIHTLSEGIPITIICGKDFQRDPGNKGLVLNTNPIFRVVCPPSEEKDK